MKSVFIATLGLALALVLAGCSSGDSKDNAAASGQTTPTSAVAPVTTPTTAASVTTPTTTALATTTTTRTALKADANTASRADIETALAAAGVPSAAQWSREVVEYRPYPTNDPNMAKLRQNLAKYNPGPGVVDLIISALSL